MNMVMLNTSQKSQTSWREFADLENNLHSLNILVYKLDLISIRPKHLRALLLVSDVPLGSLLKKLDDCVHGMARCVCKASTAKVIGNIFNDDSVKCTIAEYNHLSYQIDHCR